MALVNGTEDADQGIFGTTDNDTINGFGGFDLIFGSGGSDVIFGGVDGAVVLYGDLDSSVFVNLTDLQIGSVAPNTVVKSGGGTDTLTEIYAVHGTQLSDTIHIGSNTYVFAESGNDLIYAGRDTYIYAGSGNDTIYGAGASLAYLEGDGSRIQASGIVAVWNSATSGVVYNDGWGNTDRFFGILSISGSAYGDYIATNIGNDWIDGGGGDDALYGNGGNDYILGGGGDDYLSGGEGIDQLFGHDGDDSLYGGLGYNVLDGGFGNDVYFVDSSIAANNVITDAEGTADVLQVLDTADRNAWRFVFDGTTLVHETLNGHLTEIAVQDGQSVVEYLQWMGSEDYGTDNYLNTLRIVTDLSNITGRLIAVAGTDGDDSVILPEEQPLAGEFWGEVYANGGNDFVQLSSTFQYITYAGEGNDTVLGSGNVNDSVAGDSGDDLIDGAGGDDDINGGAGNDLIFGRSGNDTLSGGAGNDQLDGGTGNDSLLGGEGDDFIIGGLGADTVVGGSGYNSLAYDREPRTQGVVVTFTSASGGTVVDEGISLDQFDGIQQISGSRFRDVMTGTGGDQVLNGLDGDDTVSGGDGNDLLYGGSGNDMLFGGAGDDIIDDGLGYDTINGGAGVDTFKRFYDGVDYGTVLALDLNRGLTYSPTSPGDGSDFLIEIENLEVSGGYTFLLMGNSQQNVLKSASGDDTLYGMGGSDSLLAGEGDDLLSGGLGDDYLDGGAGTDTVTYAGQTGSVIASLVAGTATGADGNDRFINVENLIGGNGNDTLTGNAAANTLTGGVGNDTLNGGLGNDRLIGGAGNDIYVINGGDTIVEDTAAGTDTVQSTVAYTLGLNLENLTLTGTSAINGTGNTLNNVISGNSAANTLNGGIGNDTLNGGLGNDRLIGGVGNDVYVINGGDTIVEDVAAGTDTVQSTVAYALGLNLENLTLTGSGAINGTGNTLNNVITGNGAANTLNGGIGNDRITGGLGKDTLVGGVGADTFVFNTISDSTTVSTTWDIITDFTRGQDKIDLRTIDAFGPSAANDAFLWKGTAAFSSASAGEARFQKYDNAGTANDYTVVFLDNDADMAVEMAIRLNGLQNLAASDFMV